MRTKIINQFKEFKKIEFCVGIVVKITQKTPVLLFKEQIIHTTLSFVFVLHEANHMNNFHFWIQLCVNTGPPNLRIVLNKKCSLCFCWYYCCCCYYSYDCDCDYGWFCCCTASLAHFNHFGRLTTIGNITIFTISHVSLRRLITC